jgi:hypothetical protein
MNHVRVTYPALTKAQVVERLTRAYAGLRRRLPVTKMILYGSYAQGRHTAGSDIDVIVVYSGKQNHDAYRLIIEEAKLPRLEPKVYTEEQFNSMIAGSRRFAEALEKEGIVIAGGPVRGMK